MIYPNIAKQNPSYEDVAAAFDVVLPGTTPEDLRDLAAARGITEPLTQPDLLPLFSGAELLAALRRAVEDYQAEQ